MILAPFLTLQGLCTYSHTLQKSHGCQYYNRSAKRGGGILNGSSVSNICTSSSFIHLLPRSTTHKRCVYNNIDWWERENQFFSVYVYSTRICSVQSANPVTIQSTRLRSTE